MILPSPWLLLGAALVVAGAYVKGRFDGAAPAEARLERERTAWANERTKAAERASAAMQIEIEAHNALSEQLHRQEALFSKERENDRARIAAASAAASAAERSAGRLRDALRANRLATDSALAAAGAAGQCSACTAALTVRDELLGRFDAAAGGLAEAARASSADADRQFGAASECARWADAVRGDFSVNSTPSPQAAPSAHE